MKICSSRSYLSSKISRNHNYSVVPNINLSTHLPKISIKKRNNLNNNSDYGLKTEKSNTYFDSRKQTIQPQMEYDIIAKNQLARLFQQSPDHTKTYNPITKIDFRDIKRSKQQLKSKDRLSPVYLAKMQVISPVN